ncbi:hypothetical protein CAPN003_15300 [Capnocytophaga stomatis]|nr:hypothetical protein CAPN003_15300 [Capnocytophaga stomatis]
MPYLLDTKIKVKFDGIKINSERQLFEGQLITIYEVNEKLFTSRHILKDSTKGGLIFTVGKIF